MQLTQLLSPAYGPPPAQGNSHSSAYYGAPRVLRVSHDRLTYAPAGGQAHHAGDYGEDGSRPPWDQRYNPYINPPASPPDAPSHYGAANGHSTNPFAPGRR
ncbi:hypothetical protein JCM6882_003468 [Rhodosporidiobolus microsporus]